MIRTLLTSGCCPLMGNFRLSFPFTKLNDLNNHPRAAVLACESL
jgi:hypothetical protein